MVDEPAKRFEVTRARRVLNAALGGFVKYGVCPPDTYLLTTRGRKTGFLRTVPINLVDNSEGRFLVAPYGEVDWVRNIRADGFATLRKGGWVELVSVRELDAAQAAPVLREYMDHPRALVVAPYFDVPPEAPAEAFEAEAHRHPVFEVVRSTTIRI